MKKIKKDQQRVDTCFRFLGFHSRPRFIDISSIPRSMCSIQLHFSYTLHYIMSYNLICQLILEFFLQSLDIVPIIIFSQALCFLASSGRISLIDTWFHQHTSQQVVCLDCIVSLFLALSLCLCPASIVHLRAFTSFYSSQPPVFSFHCYIHPLPACCFFDIVIPSQHISYYIPFLIFTFSLFQFYSCSCQVLFFLIVILVSLTFLCIFCDYLLRVLCLHIL